MYDAMDYIASYFGFDGIEKQDEQSELKDWDVFKKHNLRLPEKKPIV